MSKYKIYIRQNLKLLELLVIALYFFLNIFPLYVLRPDFLLAFFLIIPMISLTIFLGSDYLKATRNIYLFLIWLIMYLIVFIIQTDFLQTFDKLSVQDISFMTKSTRLPLIGIIYSQIFRLIFVSKYRYEPTMYWNSDKIFHMIKSKQTKNKEDYIWFFIGRFLVLIIIIFINFVLLK